MINLLYKNDNLDKVNADLANCIPYVGNNKDVLSTSLTSYTAEKDGILLIVAVCKNISTIADTTRINITLDNGFRRTSIGGSNNYSTDISMPIKKGQTATFQITNANITNIEFYY